MQYKSSLLNNASSSIASPTPFASQYIPSLMMLDPDTEPIIEIDSDLRKITVPQELFNIAVCGDHLSETIYFTCPRYFDGNDLSEHTCLIRFINAGNEYGESSVIDVTVESDVLRFGWVIDNYVTRYSGKIQFTVQFETENNGIKYQWQTTPAELNIMAGLNIEKTITEKDDVLFRTLTHQIQELQEQVSKLQESVTSVTELQKRIQKIESDVNYLQENVVYTLSE